MAGAILEGHLRTQKNMFFRCFLGTVFLHFLEIRVIHTTPKKAPFWLTFGSPLGAFGAPLGDFLLSLVTVGIVNHRTVTYGCARAQDGEGGLDD